MMLHFCAASAQIHLESHIENKKTGEALSFASVYIDGGKSTITNIDGDFMIEADSTDILRISYVGYKTIRIPATQVGSTIKLESDDHTLGEVVVLAANQTSDAMPVTFQVVGKKARTALLPANSLNTFVL